MMEVVYRCDDGWMIELMERKSIEEVRSVLPHVSAITPDLAAVEPCG